MKPGLILVACALAGGSLFAGVRTLDRHARSTDSRAFVSMPDRRPAKRDWGGASLRDAQQAAEGLVPAGANVRERVIAANLVVSRMRNGPPAGTPDTWPDYLTLGLANGSCGRRAELLATLIDRMAPGTPTRHARMASVPKQGAHTTLEVQLKPGRWAWFDPSAGLFFTVDGTLDGRVLSQQEVFADPSIVDRLGPFAPVNERQDVAPHRVTFAGTIDEHIQREPGFTRSNFPLRSMFETASSWGSEDPFDPRPGRLFLHATERPEIVAATLDDQGRIIRNKQRAADGRLLAWQGRAGVSSRGINVVPVVEIDGLQPGSTFDLVITWIERDADVVMTPLVATGGRVSRWTRVTTGSRIHRDVHELTATIVPESETCVVVLMHAADEYNERAEILSYRVVGTDPAISAQP